MSKLYDHWLNDKEHLSYDEYLEKRVLALSEFNDRLQSLLDTFWTGDIPSGASLEHMVLAKAGRLRLQEKAKVCALLSVNQGT